MKYLCIPADVVMVDPAGQPTGETVSFATFIRNVILNHSRWGETPARLRQSVAVQAAIDPVAVGSHAHLEDGWHELLVACAEHPAAPYQPHAFRQLIPFFDAIENASSERPEKG